MTLDEAIRWVVDYWTIDFDGPPHAHTHPFLVSRTGADTEQEREAFAVLRQYAGKRGRWR